MTSFAATWLAPRIGRFTAAHPWIELSLHTSPDIVSLGAGVADIAIRHGLGNYKGVTSEWLFRPHLVPVGSPDLLRTATIQSPANCLRLPLVQDADGMDWTLWLRALGVSDPEGRASRGPRLGDDHLLIRAAVAGQGLALVRDTYVRADLMAGRLAVALDVPQPTNFAYRLVTRPGAAKQRPAIAAFRKLIMAEIASDRDNPRGSGEMMLSLRLNCERCDGDLINGDLQS